MRDWLGHEFPTKFGKKEKNLNFQHKFPTQISKPFSSALLQFLQADWKPFATLDTAPGSSRKSTFTGMALCNQPMGKAGHKNFWKITNWKPPKKWRWMVQTCSDNLCNLLPCWFSGRYMPRFLGFMSKIFHGVYMPKGFTSQQMGHRTWLIPRCLACQVYRRGSRSDVSPPFRFWGRDEKSHRFGGFSGIIWNYQMFEGFRDFP